MTAGEAAPGEPAAPGAAGPPGGRAPAKKGGPLRHVVTLLKIAVAVGLIYYLVTSGKVSTEVLRKALDSPGAIVFSIAAIGATFLCAILRWWVLLAAIDLALPLWTTTKLTMIGGFFNTFMPGAVGGGAFKMYYVVEHAPPGKRVEAATTVAVDRVIGLAAMFILVAIAVTAAYLLGQGDEKVDKLVQAVAGKLGPLGTPFAVAALVGGVLSLGLFHPGVRDWAIVQRIRRRVPGVAVGERVILVFFRSLRSPWPMFLAVLLSCASHMATVGCFYAMGRAIGETKLSFWQYVMVVPIGLMVNAIPGPPSGIGLGEAAYDYLFAVMEAAPGMGGNICVLWRIVTFAWNLVGGVAYVLHRRGEADPALLQSEG